MHYFCSGKKFVLQVVFFQMKKSLIALAFGTLGLGIAEFTMMGILPYVAADLNISIPVAGHFISAYALGVCAGAPMLILARKRPLKHILLALMALMLVGNLGAAVAPDYWSLLAARFISGLPHGAYFGVASIVAGKLADDSGYDGRQSVWRSAGHFLEPHALVARYILAGGLLGLDSSLLYMALGACGRGAERYRIQGTIPFPEDTRSLVDIGGDGFGQWRRILLV